MEKSKSIAGIVGPALLVMVLSELRAWNPSLYDMQIVPLVYLSGTLFFIAGLAVVRSHNIWVRGWPTALTIIGWFAVLLGAARMFFPQKYIAQFKNDNTALAVEIILILTGALLTYKAYTPLKKNG